MIEEFVSAMRVHVPDDARIMLCQFRGDPGEDFKGKWRARTIGKNLDIIDDRANVYLCVSAMKRNNRGEFRRRKENFAGGLLLMIDDLGTGPGSKFPLTTIESLKPTALIETSPDNFQAVYMFDSLVDDINRFEALIRAFINAQFLGQDTGMAGVNRVFRPPIGINGKRKHGGWRVRMQEWNPDCRYSVEEIASAFRLDLIQRRPIPRGATANKPDNIRAFILVRAALRSAGMIKREADLAGWSDVRCPWTEEHTNEADNGAAIRLPDPDNGWFGAFRCHHASCEGRGWRELTEWLSEADEVILERVNRSALPFDRYKEVKENKR